MKDRGCVECGAVFEGARADSPAKFCPGCRPKAMAALQRRSWERRKKYAWTVARDELLRSRYDGHVKGRSAEIGRALGWPSWVIKKRAAALGLTRDWPANRRAWTRQEESFLRRSAGHFSLHYMARKLNRTDTQVAIKCKRLAVSTRARDGYTMRHLELCFGVDHHTISKWIRTGWLPNRRRDEFEPNEDPARRSMCLTDRDLKRFILEHPTAFELRRVDQEWFMGLILGYTVRKKAS